MRLPCIICESADPYSNVVCDDCESQIEHRKETYQAMLTLVMDLNNLSGYENNDCCNQVYEKVKNIYKMLCEIKVKNDVIDP